MVATPSEEYWVAISQENVEIVRRGFDALNRGDVEGWLALCDPDVVYREAAGDRVIDLPSVLRGHEALRQAAAEWADTFHDFRYEVDELIDASDDRVVVLGRWRGKARASGADVELPESAVWTVRNGKLVDHQAFTDRAGALRAVGSGDDA